MKELEAMHTCDNEQIMTRTTRKAQLAPKILIVDGLPGCGKTMLSRIVGALDRVEKLTYSYETEMMCQLWSLGKIDDETAKTMVRTFTDMKLYNMMMGREVNFRVKDLSSAFMDGKPWRYIQRLFGPGDETVPDKVLAEKPILHLTTHHLLGIGRPLFDALGDRLLLIDVVRHPLYMVKQQALNMERLIADVRYFFMHYEYQSQEIPFWAKGWEDIFLRSNDIERAVYSILYVGKQSQENKETFPVEWRENILTIPFENFVVSPSSYMDEITEKLGTRLTPLTVKTMRKQNVPRKMFADGIALPIYKRCGWQKPRIGADESQEFADRRNWVVQQVTPEVLHAFDEFCKEYEQTHMGREQNIPGRP